MGSNRRVAPSQAWRPSANRRGQPAGRRSGAADGAYRRTVARPTAGIRSMKYRVQTLLSLIRQRGVANPLCPLIRGCGFRGGLSRQHYRSRPPARGRCVEKGQQGLGCSRGGLSTKIHAAVDGLGILSRFILTGEERHDITEAENLLSDMQAVESVVADKAFDAASLLQPIRALGAKAVIPPRVNRKEARGYDIHYYKSRNLIERFFARIKQFRRIATRYDKLAGRFSVFIFVTAPSSSSH